MRVLTHVANRRGYRQWRDLITAQKRNYFRYGAGDLIEAQSATGDSRLLRKLSVLRSRSFTRTFFAAPVLKSRRRDLIAMGIRRLYESDAYPLVRAHEAIEISGPRIDQDDASAGTSAVDELANVN